MSLYESRANKLWCFDALAAGASSGFYTGRDQSRRGFQYYSLGSKVELNFVLHFVNYAKKNSTMNWCNSCTRWIQLNFFTISCHENYLFRRSIKVKKSRGTGHLPSSLTGWSGPVDAFVLRRSPPYSEELNPERPTTFLVQLVAPHVTLIKGASGVPV
jgi:hypothetical protein